MPKPKIGVLLSNLGTPDEPTPNAVKRYLKQFLSDPRVIDLPRGKWLPILNFIILPRRSPKVAKNYQSIWGKDGSPLLSISRQQQQAIQAYFNQRDKDFIIELGMTYGNPSIDSAIEKLLAKKVDKIIVLPLYPQYGSTTTAPVFDAFARSLTRYKNIVPFEFIHNYYNHPLYINALVNTIKLEQNEFLVFSFHGIPQRYDDEGDYYAYHCRETARLVAESLKLENHQWCIAFQSRFGREEWLKPYTDIVLQELPNKGIKKVAVICPGFSADCLETLEEIAEENREYFLESGGESYRYIPALNSNTDHIHLLTNLIEEKC